MYVTLFGEKHLKSIEPWGLKNLWENSILIGRRADVVQQS